MSQIQNIDIDIALSTRPVTQKGFGLIAVIGTTPRNLKYELIAQGMKFAAKVAGEQHIKVEFVVSGNETPLAVSRAGAGTEADPFVITAALQTDDQGVAVTTAAQLKTAAEAAANIAGASGIVEITLSGTGTEVLVAMDETDLVDPSDPYIEVTDVKDMVAPGVGYTSAAPEYKKVAAIFSQTPRADRVAVIRISDWANLADELNDIRDTYDDWYWVIIASHVKAHILSATQYVNSLEKFALFASNDDTILDVWGNPDRAVLAVSEYWEDAPDAAWVGRCGTVAIGSISWDSKQLNGQRNSGVSMSRQGQILAKNGNLIREMGGVNVTWEGKTGSGQYIDNINGRDLTHARLLEALQFLKINTPKLSFTLTGIRMTEAALREVFRGLGRDGVIAPVESPEDRANSDIGDYQYKLTMPESVSAVSVNDRANRSLPAIKFSCVVGGGINKFSVSGTMRV